MQKKYFWFILWTNILLFLVFFLGILWKSSLPLVTSSFPTVVKNLRPSVVALFSNEDDFYVWERQDIDQQDILQKGRLHVGWSAFFIDTNWYLLTSRHVVEDLNPYIAVLDDGSSWKVDKIWFHPTLDLAILHVQNPLNRRFSVASIKEESSISIWEESFIIWTPFSQYHNSLSAGILAGTWRILNIESAKSYSGLYQLDMNINPGNSWGPVFDKQWNIFWIVTAISSQSSHIGFALPISQKLISTLLIDIEKKTPINVIQKNK